MFPRLLFGTIRIYSVPVWYSLRLEIRALLWGSLQTSNRIRNYSLGIRKALEIRHSQLYWMIVPGISKLLSHETSLIWHINCCMQKQLRSYSVNMINECSCNFGCRSSNWKAFQTRVALAGTWLQFSGNIYNSAIRHCQLSCQTFILRCFSLSLDYRWAPHQGRWRGE